jgi:undecaprenyl diphosphate synthase
MDGNGRWAKQRGLPRLRGHESGAESVLAALRACRTSGVEFLTLYAFSRENWVRPKAEITGLMGLLRHFLTHREAELHENRVRLRVMGHLQDLSADIVRELQRVATDTQSYTDRQLILALSYGGRTEITDAARKLAGQVARGEIPLEAITEQTLANQLYTPDVPDPDLLIRTSGELRLSNFLLWQLSYTELYFTDVTWPDFRETEFQTALDAYAQRKRRFGDVK